MTDLDKPAPTKYIATFTPEVWIGDNAVAVDPEGPTTWDCTSAVEANADYWFITRAKRREDFDWPGVVDNDDTLKQDPAAPQWTRDWSGPFTIRVHREEMPVEQIERQERAREAIRDLYRD